MYLNDKQAVRDTIELKLVASAHLEMAQRELDKAIATSTSVVKEKTFPKMYDCLKKGRMIQVEHKLRLLHKCMVTHPLTFEFVRECCTLTIERGLERLVDLSIDGQTVVLA